jgi:RNA ligase (TIGR02306 family)
VVKKSEFNVGDLCVYFEIDSHLPVRPEFEILRRNSSKRMGEREGFRIKTIKLRGQLSQGLALPVNLFFNDFIDSDEDEGQELSEFFMVGTDVSDLLDIQKYEAAIPTELAGQVKGNFPAFIRKTDQERCQNMKRDIFVDNADARYEISMKFDGTSFTAFVKDGVPGVCGRNWELKLDDPKNEHNSLVRMFVDSGLHDIMRSFDRDFAVQAELMGPGIQKNREAFASHKLFVFDIFNITTGGYVPPRERHLILDELWARGVNREMVHHVPVLHMDVPLYEFGLFDVDKLLAFAEGPSIKHAIREGLVYKRMDGGFSFKTISNKFLLKEED